MEEEGDLAYAYLPYIYLYMGSADLRQQMFDDGAIDRQEYETWELAHALYHSPGFQVAKLMIPEEAFRSTYEEGFVKVHGGIMDLGPYKAAFLWLSFRLKG